MAWNYLQLRKDVLLFSENYLFGVPKYFSNHLTFNYLFTVEFGHLKNYRLAKFSHWMSESKSSYIIIIHTAKLISFHESLGSIKEKSSFTLGLNDY